MTLDFSKCKTIEQAEAEIAMEEKRLQWLKAIARKMKELRDNPKLLLTEQEKNSY
jgi:hypothetical protein